LTLEGFIKPWEGVALRHLPDLAGIEVYDFSFCGLSSENRWNVHGEPTLYLAGDKQVAIGEFSRHFDENRSRSLIRQIHRRKIWCFSVQLDRTLNLCNPQVWEALSLSEAPDCFKDKQVARATAEFVRRTLKIEAIFVPSMVFLDDMSKWCLVLFLDNLPTEATQFLPKVQELGYLEIE
jgi:RES domain-containing protein